MAYPVVEAVQPGELGPGQTAFTIPPHDAGDMLVLILGTPANRDVTSISALNGQSWTNIVDTASTGERLHIYFLVAGSNQASATTVDISVELGAEAVGQCYRISGIEGHIDANAITGTSSTPNPPSVNPGWGSDDILWIAAEIGDAAVIAAPSDYTNLVDNSVQFLGTLGTARRNLTAASEDPGQFTVASSVSWVAAVIAVRPSQNTPPTADAGPDQEVDEGDAVFLDGSGSDDAEDGPGGLNYVWTVLDDGGTGLTNSGITDRLTDSPTFVAPNLPVAVTVRAWGAQGGGANGGLGGYAEGTFILPVGTPINVRVGGQGAAPSQANGQTDPGQGQAGGFNGGGRGGYYYDNFLDAGILRLGGSGGGASDVRWDGDTLADRKIVAGGGGGQSTHATGTGGHGGGTTGQAGGTGPNQSPSPGGGGTDSAGGAGGTSGSGSNGGDGALGVGGDGGIFVTNGNNGGGPAGGGGGYYGGGGGKSTSGFGEAGGGGGGSGFVDPSADGPDMDTGVRSGNGRIEIEVGGNTTVFDTVGQDTFVVPASQPATEVANLVIQLEVEDSGGLTDTDTVTITVNRAANIIIDHIGRGGLAFGGEADSGFQRYVKVDHTGRGGLVLGGDGSTEFKSFTVRGIPALVRAVRGSHTIKVRARVLDTYQTGINPVGVEIPVLDGDVLMDAHADERSSLDLLTDGHGTFPENTHSLLGPFGNEVYVERGVVGFEYVPLGYFRIQAAEQESTPRGPIRIAGRDRMAAIIEARMLEPRQYPAGTSFQEIFDDLVLEVYPHAVLRLDDGFASTTLLNPSVVEEHRYAFLNDLARSRGKVMFFDSHGVLVVTDPPDVAEPVFSVTHGDGGVLIDLSRQLSREDVFNGVVAYGEEADFENDEPPPRAFVVDSNPASATYWHGRFGKVTRYYSSPFITTDEQAASAAASILKQSLGLPYGVDFSAVPNPALRPLDPVLVSYTDGGEPEVHVIDNIRIPLAANAEMTANTRALVEFVGEAA